MIQAIQITAYKCPFCGCISVDKVTIETHALTCCGKPDYTQKCIECVSLNDNFVVTNLYGKGICFHSGPFSHGCPYVNHDSTEVDLEIQRSHDVYTKFSNYDSSVTPQENWEKEEKYDKLRSSGVEPDEAKRLAYSD